MPNFENMESFGYTLLQIPLESLIISYPIHGIKEILEKIPKETYSNELEDNNTESSNITKSDVTSVDINASAIDPNELTGIKGISRMMNYKDIRTPPEKGSYEYKKTTLDKYGRIFSREKIDKYSCKIKTILDCIVGNDSKEINGKVSEGIILIYSQYIDGGLIPMALALEEIGFTRYGENSKPLFKVKPCEVVDVRTMKPPTDKKDFKPARYAMITGDTRLSPNNDYEVKGLTSEDNKDGHKVKIVLISKAGSEGIDFKYIRQVHILEPWYNMNRIEQIIGRGVRNFSHKDLPFEKRNVQIFMHGTILGNKKEEAADLYVYRVAEFKAVQIGQVTRILKETSVDCILNHDQANFTQDMFQQILDEPIKQILSDGQVIENYKIGDAPFSPACDYMPTCDYKCRPDKKIDEKELNEDTYNEVYIVMNSEKIMQKIRMLMKENFFYQKKTLLQLIQTPKPYPYAQIYSALTQLIEDRNEYITDKYGRTGHLINIGDYYLFQPIELSDLNTSIYERSVPVDYKHSSIDFQLQEKVAKHAKEKQNKLEDINEINKINEINENEEIKKIEIGKKSEEVLKMMQQLKINYELAIEYTKKSKVQRGDDDWYKHCGIIMKKMSIDYPESKKYLIEFLVDHMMDTLLYHEKITIMNYLYSLEQIEKDSLEWFAKDYFVRNSIVTKTITAIILYDVTKRKIMILNKQNKWIEAEPEDERELAESKEAKQYLNIDKSTFNTNIGFIGYEKNERYLVFKTKDITAKRNTGARCDEAGKQKTIELLNTIIGEEKYTKENTKLIKEKDGTVIQEASSQTELCVLQEFILRYFNKIKKDDKVCFLSTEIAIFMKL